MAKPPLIEPMDELDQQLMVVQHELIRLVKMVKAKAKASE